MCLYIVINRWNAINVEDYAKHLLLAKNKYLTIYYY